MGKLKISAVEFGNLEQLKQRIVELTNGEITENDIENSKWLNEYQIGWLSSWRTRIKNYEISIETSFDETLWWVYVEKIN